MPLGSGKVRACPESLFSGPCSRKPTSKRIPQEIGVARKARGSSALSLSEQGRFMTACPVFLSSRTGLASPAKGRLCYFTYDGLDIRSISWGRTGAGQRHGKGLQKSAQPDLRCRTTHRRHSRETVLPGAGQKTNGAQAVVRGSQGQLDVSALCTREQGPGSDTEQGRSSRPRHGRGGSQPRGSKTRGVRGGSVGG